MSPGRARGHRRALPVGRGGYYRRDDGAGADQRHHRDQPVHQDPAAAGTAGCWFLLDYAYYGNTISTPQIIGLISPGASATVTIAIQLAIFVVAAVPGYILAIVRMDRIGHRRLQLIGRATGHGISAGIGKFGAFIGVFLFPVLQQSLGLRGTLLLTAAVSGLGALLTLVLPEPARRSRDDICGQPERVSAAELAAPGQRAARGGASLAK